MAQRCPASRAHPLYGSREKLPDIIALLYARLGKAIMQFQLVPLPLGLFLQGSANLEKRRLNLARLQ